MFSLFSWGQPPHAFRDDLRIEGVRVTLRPRTRDDADAMYGYLCEPDVVRFLPWTPAPSSEAIRPMLSETIDLRRKGEALGMAIVLRESGAMIGQADLMDLKATRGQAELGYVVARPYWGAGLMSEAARLIVAYGFSALKLNKVVAYADAENHGSCRVLEKLRMRQAARETRVVKGESRSYLRYEVTRENWCENRDDTQST